MPIQLLIDYGTANLNIKTTTLIFFIDVTLMFKVSDVSADSWPSSIDLTHTILLTHLKKKKRGGGELVSAKTS